MAKRPTVRDRLQGYDSFERHHAVSTLLGPAFDGTLLDAGGLSGKLKRCIPAARVTALNLDATGDIVYDGGVFPFVGRAFEAVVSLDTLEHIPRRGRDAFVQQCARVARRTLMIAAPYGTAGHSAREARLDRLYSAINGATHRWLHEHVTEGLPDDADITGYRGLLREAGFNVAVYYSGDYGRQCDALERSVQRAARLGPFRRLGTVLDLIAQVADWPMPVLTRSPYPQANRFYLFGARTPDAPAPGHMGDNP